MAAAHISARFDEMDRALECLNRMEENLALMRQIRDDLASSLVEQMIASLIEEAELEIAGFKRKVIQ
jgi:hypothetical protein